MRRRTSITRNDALKVLAALRRQYKSFLEPWEIDGKVYPPTYEEPLLVMDWEWPGEPVPSILWEGGPYEWTYVFPHGGRSEERFDVEDVSEFIPAHVMVEPWAGWATCLHLVSGDWRTI